MNLADFVTQPESMTWNALSNTCQIHLWWISLEPWRAFSAHVGEYLSPDERRRFARLRIEKTRVNRILVRGLVRLVLARYLQRNPRRIAIGYGVYGKPKIVWPQQSPQLEFSISHSKGVACIAVADGRRVGIDIESADHIVSERIVSRLCDSSGLTETVQDFPGRTRREILAAAWTRAEACRKAVGCGWSEQLRIAVSTKRTSRKVHPTRASQKSGGIVSCDGQFSTRSAESSTMWNTPRQLEIEMDDSTKSQWIEFADEPLGAEIVASFVCEDDGRRIPQLRQATLVPDISHEHPNYAVGNPSLRLPTQHRMNRGIG